MLTRRVQTGQRCAKPRFIGAARNSKGKGVAHEDYVKWGILIADRQSRDYLHLDPLTRAPSA